MTTYWIYLLKFLKITSVMEDLGFILGRRDFILRHCLVLYFRWQQNLVCCSDFIKTHRNPLSKPSRYCDCRCEPSCVTRYCNFLKEDLFIYCMLYGVCVTCLCIHGYFICTQSLDRTLDLLTGVTDSCESRAGN